MYARSWPVQFQALLWKFAKTYWRFPEYNAIRYLLTLVMALLIGTNFLNLGSKRKTQQDVLNGKPSVLTPFGRPNCSVRPTS